MASPAARPLQGPGGFPKPKIMRIGIVQGGRIVEERLVRKRESISIGQSSRNMFVVPADALPKEWMLFQQTPRGYVAHFADAMDARIAVGNEVISLAQLKQAGKIRKTGPAWRMLLDERSRGKITVGDVTILFQFVTPPLPQPRPQLPASVRGSVTANLDWFFTTIAATSFLAHLALVIYLRSVDWPKKPEIDEIPDRFVQIVKKREEQPPKKEEAKKDEKKKEEDKPKKEEKRPVAAQQPAKKKEITEEEKQRQAEEKARLAEERRARLTEQVRSMGALQILGAKSAGAGSIADVLSNGGVDRDQEQAFKNVGGLTVATSDGLHGVKGGGGGTGKVASIANLRGGADIAGANTGNVSERKVTAVVKQEAPAVDGSLDAGLVAREVRARMGAVKGCYERALKRNPNLSGKIVLHWTITAAGTVQGVEAENDIGDPEVATCIKALVARWRFPAPSGGSVEVSIPFVFQASN
jgi:outer membrane biosynthesis protein TonB